MPPTVEFHDLKRLVECDICLDTLSDPKCLQCHHSYCKTCLDGILEFTADGAANIKCPKSCPQATKISNTQTTNDLGVDYIVKGLLDTISKAEGSSSEKGKCDLCSKDMVKYCKFCKTFLCHNCKDPHDDIGDSFMIVNYDNRRERLSLYCDEHGTDVAYKCCGDAYLCMYCLYRGHPAHNYERLYEVEQSLKEEVMEDLEMKNNIDIRVKEIKKYIVDSKHELDRVLNRKILKCMTDYANHLKQEAENIKRDFCNVIKEHTQRIMEFDTTEFFKNCLAKKEADFLLHESEIRTKLNFKTVPQISISLTEGSFGDDHPLGFLECHHGPKVSPITVEPFKSRISVANINPSSTSVDQLIKMLLECHKDSYMGDDTSSGKSLITDTSDSIGEEHFLGEGTVSLQVDKLNNIQNWVGGVPTKVRSLQWEAKFKPFHIDKQKYAGVFVTCKSTKEPRQWSCGACVKIILRSHNNWDISNEYFHVFKPNTPTDTWGFKKFLSWTELIDEDNGYLKKDSISFDALIEADVPFGVHWDSRKQTGYVGIKKQKHSCYTNPILQSLYCLTKFRQVLLRLFCEEEENDVENVEYYIRNLFVDKIKCGSEDTNENLAPEMRNIFFNLSHSYDVVSAKSLHKLLECEEPLTSSDLCSLLFTSIEMNLQFSDAADAITELFQGKMISHFDCGNSDHDHVRHEKFYGIELQVESEASLEESLDEYIKGGTSMDPGCNGKCKRAMQKKVVFQRFPPILQLHIKDRERFLNGICFFPNKLNLTKYLAEDIQKDEPSAFYSLYSVLVYFHSRYFVYVSPRGDGKWYKFDDTVVSRVSEEEATLKNFHKNVHMLTYIRTSELEHVLSKGTDGDAFKQPI